ncbi:RCC1-like domain-containing protein, partial [Parachitinimonas caeni]
TWGSDDFGQLGLGRHHPDPAPVRLPGLDEYRFETKPQGPLKNLSLAVNVVPSQADRGVPLNLYLAVILPDGKWLISDNGQYRLLSSQDIPSHQTFSTDREYLLPVLSPALDVSGLGGTQVIVGYGRTADEMLSRQQYQTVYTVQ